MSAPDDRIRMAADSMGMTVDEFTAAARRITKAINDAHEHLARVADTWAAMTRPRITGRQAQRSPFDIGRRA